MGVPGTVLFIFFQLALLRLAFSGILIPWLGLGLGLPLLSNLAGPIQHFKAALLDAWRNKVTADLCGRKGFRGGPLFDIHGSLQLPNSSHVRERDKALLRTIMVGGVWNGFLLGRVRVVVFVVKLFLVGSVGLLTIMVTFSGIVLFLLLLRFVKILNFMIS